MPEGLEAEIWRRSARALIGRRIVSVWCDERVAPEGLAQILADEHVDDVSRIGKVVRLHTTAGVVGLHFGMTGRLEVDGSAPIERLEYASGADRPEWDRLRIATEPAGRGRPALRLNDPRRLGRISLDEVITVGADCLSLSETQLAAGIFGRRAPVKSMLLDQRVVAGLGNLCADEVLFHAGVAPERPVDSLRAAELAMIALACRERLPQMLAAGGSTAGTLSPEVREAPLPCPLDGAQLRRDRIGGRTAVWCPAHQH